MPEKLKNHHIILGIFIIIIVLLNSYFAFQTPYFEADAYFQLRQTENILENKHLIINDPLSYSGHTQALSPLFYYILAFGQLILPSLIIAKLLPIIFASLLIPLVYLLSKELTKNKKVSLIFSFFAGVIPIFYSATFNTISTLTLALPLFLLVVYSFLKLTENKKYVITYVVSISLFTLTTPLSLALIPGFFIYVLLLKIENLKLKKEESELILFSILLILWTNFLIFRKVIEVYGLNILWQNIPMEILRTQFLQTSLFDMLFSISIIPLILGLIAVHHTIIQRRIRTTFFISSFALMFLILTWSKLLSFEQGLVYFSILLLCLAARGFQIIENYFLKSKIKHINYFRGLIILLLILTLLIPAFLISTKSVNEVIDETKLNSLNWIEKNTPLDSIILGNLEEGHLINYFAKRKNIMDTNFLLANNPEYRITDAETIYKTSFKTTAIGLLNKYEIDYILLTKDSLIKYNISDLTYVTEDCFKKVYDLQGIKIYESKCMLVKG